MTDIYYECIIHGRQYVSNIEITTVQRLVGMGTIETVYKLECGCEVVNCVASRGNMF